MKKTLFVLLALLFLSGCGAAARESGFYEHGAIYRDWDHFKFSLYGYKHPEPKDAQLSKERDWWGTTVEQAQP